MTPMDELIDAIATCIVGCQGRTNRDRALAVLAVIDEQGWAVVPRDAPVFEFLLGAAKLQGRWFGERHKPMYWWRWHLRAALKPPKEEA